MSEFDHQNPDAGGGANDCRVDVDLGRETSEHGVPYCNEAEESRCRVHVRALRDEGDCRTSVVHQKAYLL